jgi:hypothetical protein
MEILKNNYYIFDGRFLLVSRVSGKIIPNTKQNIDKINKENDLYKYKEQINNSLPIIQTLEGENIKPHLRIIHNNDFEKDKLKYGYFGLYLINRLLV